jgi:hypothetical protein
MTTENIRMLKIIKSVNGLQVKTKIRPTTKNDESPKQQHQML